MHKVPIFKVKLVKGFGLSIHKEDYSRVTDMKVTKWSVIFLCLMISFGKMEYESRIKA